MDQFVVKRVLHDYNGTYLVICPKHLYEVNKNSCGFWVFYKGKLKLTKGNIVSLRLKNRKNTAKRYWHFYRRTT